MDLEALQASLDEARSWRKLELSHARALAESRRGCGEEAYLCRAWTMMIYAHCDQALKLVAKAYMKFLMTNPRADYDYQTVWLAFFGKEAIRNVSHERFSLCSAKDEGANLKKLSGITGKEIFSSSSFSYSSLRFFCEWVIQCQLDHNKYSAFCTTLKDKRDAIAHGEVLFIKDVDDCIAWHEPAISLLDDLADFTLKTAIRHAA
ncbi:hypothetical protein GAY33_08010 [Azospirillum brasilense]|uniref:MAE_28990/MAE_18760 family HEPN-like nuclease n=1 Tax=Azospirillum argentinense TaxID=2970906 RepID=UPI00190DEB05|nr:MAE_28990/MAE_18760 family HEPN-like nuclease [Azospirillum argentinense]MBK3799171.1 hypothetical protein [Azospirillum argentinense]